MRPGQEERIEFEYIRHGTLCLIASFDVVSGESVSPTVSPTRTEEDFLEHCKRTVMLHPKSSWRLIMDQLNTHASESLVRWVVAMEELKLSADELGVKGKSGILKSLATGKEFLSSPDRRLRFVYVPKHSSWLNQVEIWFSVVVRRVLKQESSPHLTRCDSVCWTSSTTSTAQWQNPTGGRIPGSRSPHEELILTAHDRQNEQDAAKADLHSTLIAESTSRSLSENS